MFNSEKYEKFSFYRNDVVELLNLSEYQLCSYNVNKEMIGQRFIIVDSRKDRDREIYYLGGIVGLYFEKSQLMLYKRKRYPIGWEIYYWYHGLRR